MKYMQRVNGNWRDICMKLKIFCVSSSRNNAILRIDETLTSLELPHQMCFLDSYDETHTYWQRKLAKIFHPERPAQFYQQEVLRMAEVAEQYAPDIVLVINPNLPLEVIERLKKIAKVVFWFVDSIVGLAECQNFRGCKNVVYDRESLAYLTEQGIPAEYCPVGYNDVYIRVKSIAKAIDISFVGTPYKNRLSVLEPIAEAATAHSWNLKIYAPLFKTAHFWKPLLFRLKHPALFRYIVNGSFPPEEVAKIYAQSCICLNIHDEHNKGTNPRTFEIMAAGSFELLDVRRDYDILEPGRDMAVYRDAADAVEKIAHYLADEAAREKLAAAGKATIEGKRSMRNILCQILDVRQD